MSEVVPSPLAPAGAAAECLYAFGVALLGTTRLSGLLAGPVRDGERQTTVTVVDRAAIDAGWPFEQAQRLVDRRLPDGSPFMSIDHHALAGYLIEVHQVARHGIACGAHRVTSDGRSWSAWLPAGPDWRWQRLAFAQTLPMIATLHGLAVFHASAVAIGDRVYGLLGPSGAGKSAIASHLIAGGATFFSDDVLALEAGTGAVMAHPGPQFSSVYGHDLATLSPVQRARLGTPIGVSDKHHLQPQGIARPMALGGLFFLERGTYAGRVVIERAQDSPRRLLGSAFAPHLTSAARLLSQLDVCAAIATRIELHHVAIGTDASVGGVASAIAELARAR